MQTLFAASFEGTLLPTFDVRCLDAGTRMPDGWGIGFYPGGEPSASVIKEAAPSDGPVRRDFVAAWDHLASSLFMIQLRTAHWGALNFANTQPFARTMGRRDWLFAHSGSLERRIAQRAKRVFEPVGSTDTEEVFCELLERITERGWSSLLAADLAEVQQWFDELGAHGDMTCVLCDGRDLLAYAGHGEEQLWFWQILPPFEKLVFGDQDLVVDLTRRGPVNRKGVVFSSSPLKSTNGVETSFLRLEAGQLMIVREGAVIADLPPQRSSITQLSQVGSRWSAPRPKQMEAKVLAVTHRTVYRYSKPVEHSSHLLRLQPVHDRLQRVTSFDLSVSVDGKMRDYEDVFGNHVRKMELTTPFTELAIEARSRVRVLDTTPLNYRPIHHRSSIPLVWMPWQREILQPYLLPVELPESQLRELTDYAMSFVERNAYDLLDTLLDINMSIFKEYKYQPGSTTLGTTPFEVYTNRAGVCQDFANLMICLARLLSVPARYVCGYIFCGPKNANNVQSEASHAWIQVYLPEHGWTGFDPTNGVITQTDHVRVAVGRNYLDATPTSGTIYEGGGYEVLEVDVVVEPAEEDFCVGRL
jgi:transglutaminase-like putative cysteine protease/predicted glutamine amidotransferase